MYQEFYTSNAEEVLGGKCTYRQFVFDLQAGTYEVDMFDLAQYGDKWFVLRANGCSCWGGEWNVEAGPFDRLDEVREYITKEYGTQVSDYYEEFVSEWMDAISRAESHW
jgi:hypothetical protein